MREFNTTAYQAVYSFKFFFKKPQTALGTDTTEYVWGIFLSKNALLQTKHRRLRKEGGQAFYASAWFVHALD